MQKFRMVVLVSAVIALVTLIPLRGAPAEAPQSGGTYTFRVIAGLVDSSRTVADGSVENARFSNPTTIVRATDGTVFVLEGTSATNAGIRQLKDNTVTTVTATVNTNRMTTTSDGTLFVVRDGTIARRLPNGTLTTYAGGTEGYVDGPLASARFAALSGVAVDTAGNIYLSEGFPGLIGYCFPDQMGNQIRKISAAGQVTTLAGATCQQGSTDGQGTAARFDRPSEMVVDASGTLYVIDSGNRTIRRITADGTVTTLAGTAGQSGTADGVGAAARFSNPRSLTLGPDRLYLLDGASDAAALRSVAFDGTVTTLATVTGVMGIAVETSTTLLATYQGTVSRMTLSGALTTIAGALPDPTAGPGSADGPGATARFRDLRGIIRDDRGGVYLTDAQNETIRYVSATGIVSTLAGAVQQSGLVDGTGTAARFNLPQGIARAVDGTVYVADEYNNRVRRITPAGVVTTLPDLSGRPVDVTTDAAGNVYVAQQFAAVQRVTPADVVSMYLNTVSTRILAEPSGSIIVTIPGTGPRRFGADGSAGPILTVPVRAVDAAGRLYAKVTESGTTLIRRLNTDGSTTDFATVMPPAGTATIAYEDLAVTDAGDIYLTRGVELLLGTLTARSAPTVATPTTTAVWAGATAQLTAVVAGTPEPAVQWQVSTDGGTTWSDVANDTTYSGARTTTLSVAGTTTAMTSRRFRVVATNLEGTATSPSATLSINGLTASPSVLRFSGRRLSPETSFWTVTGEQSVTISASGTPAPVWTATANRSWVAITGGSGTGSGRFTIGIQQSALSGLSGPQSATVTVSAPNVSVSETFTVLLDLHTDTGFKNSTVGMVDTPVQFSTGVQGAISMSGWAVSDIGVGSVKIYRNCAAFETTCIVTSGLPQMGPVVEVGDATLVEGARPDVEAVYPNAPGVRRAGWGLMILSNMLPNVPAQTLTGGVGSFTFYAVAFGGLATPKILGRTTLDEAPTQITVANDTIAKPFGAIDTPGQGATVSGSVNNFGWVLTPDPGTGVLMPTNGSTIRVFVDGADVGAATYDLCRGSVAVGGVVPSGQLCDDDVSAAFRGNGTRYRNLDAGRGPIGLRSISTTSLSNGLHTLSWAVTDSAGRSEGIGSRYINVLNTSADQGGEVSRWRDGEMPLGTSALRHPGTSVFARTGFDLSRAFTPLVTDADGVAQVRIPELGRVEMQLPGVISGAWLVNGEERPLPVGVGIDVDNGVVTWAPGPGFLGTYRLAFGTPAPRHLGTSAPRHIEVTVVPAQLMADAGVRMHIDRAEPQCPSASLAHCPISIAGWSLDTGASSGAGIGAVHVWAKRVLGAVGSGEPVFLGVAELGIARPDVAAAHGAQYPDAGFTWAGALPDAGTWEITAYVWSWRTGRFEDARTVTVVVK